MSNQDMWMWALIVMNGISLTLLQVAEQGHRRLWNVHYRFTEKKYERIIKRLDSIESKVFAHLLRD